MTGLLYGILRTAYSDIETGIETHVITMKRRDEQFRLREIRLCDLKSFHRQNDNGLLLWWLLSCDESLQKEGSLHCS